jgi:NADPH:quinone reductase-like Zn-dependent oxidoreductase
MCLSALLRGKQRVILPAIEREHSMRALRFRQFGTPEVLKLETVADPRSDADHAIVSVRAASINPSDVANVGGRFPATTLSRIPGRDYAGVVVDGPADWVGAEVWGTGDAGFAVDGSHAELIRVPVLSLRRKPSKLSFDEAASIGVTFMAAWLGVVDYAALRRSETLVVIGASGGVGGAAVQIGSRIGARVIGIDRSPPTEAAPATKLAERIITPPTDEAAAAVLDLTDGRGADVVINTVGAATFESSLAMLAHRGRLAVLASPGQPRQSFDILDFYHNESQLFGVDTLKRDMTASATLLDAIGSGFEEGSFLAPIIAKRVGLDDAIEAYRSVAAGARGRIVLAPQQD